MFGWFSPKCPVGTWEKAWTETRMRWLAERFGVDRLTRAEVVLPEAEYFPDPYDGMAADARRMMDRLCGYMGVNPAAVELRVSPDEQLPGAAGRYERRPRGAKAVVRVAASQLADPEALAATLAHELAHEILLGGGYLDESIHDHELVTDLLPVFLGVGVFAANSTIRDASWTDGNWSWWSIRRQGYLPSRVFGYALALFALARGEERPAWGGYLRPDAAGALRGGLDYVRRTGDCLFDPDAVRGGRATPTEAGVIEQLDSRSPSARLAALWDVEDYGLTGPACLEAVAARLDDRDQSVAGQAARTLGVFGPPAAPIVPRLVELLWLGTDPVRAGAAHALGSLRLRAEEAVPELARLLKEPGREVFAEAARALGAYGVRSDEAVEPLLAELETALIECDQDTAEDVGRALMAVAEDPTGCVRRYFAARGGVEFERRALETLAGVDLAADSP
jgi:HEAT repeat protein